MRYFVPDPIMLNEESVDKFMAADCSLAKCNEECEQCLYYSENKTTRQAYIAYIYERNAMYQDEEQCENLH